MPSDIMTFVLLMITFVTMNLSKNNFKLLLIVSLLFNGLAVVGFFVGKRIYYAHTGYLNSHPNGDNDSLVTYTFNRYKVTESLVELYKVLPHDTTDVVFLGTSLTQGFPLQEMFKNSHLKNRGIGGNTTTDILSRVDEAILGKPRKLFLEAGTNDMGKYHTVDTPYNNIVKIARMVKQYSPRTHLFIQSVLPLGSSNMYKPVIAINTRLANFCAKNNIVFINLYPLFLKDSVMNKTLTTDGTHLKANGYLIWKANIEKFVNE